MESQSRADPPDARVRDALSPLSDDDVRQIAALVEALDRSALDFLQLELGDLKLTIGKGDAPAAAAVAVSPPPARPASAAAAATPAAPADMPPRQVRGEAARDGSVAIVAPIMGRFYAKPDPGAAPFVSVGSEVNEDSTVALIEVMKVFNAVPAGVRGVITEICVQDAEIIEYGQVMFLVRPASA